MNSTPNRLLKGCLTACVVLLTALAGTTAQADEEVLRTKRGGPLKIIVREPAAIYAEPDLKSPNRPVDAFSFFYLLPAKEGTQEKQVSGFYRIATASKAKAHVGWIPADVALEWTHGQVGGFTPHSHRQRILFFRDKEDSIRWFKGDKRTEAMAISREPEQLQGVKLFPLLDISSFEHDGESVEVYKVAYLAGTNPGSAQQGVNSDNVDRKHRPAPAGQTTVTRDDLKREFVLQVVFVLDTTRSMQPWINAMKQVIAACLQRFADHDALRGRVEFGLVCYRDQLELPEDREEMEYVAKVVCDLTSDLGTFQGRLAQVQEATIGSEDFPEDVLAGLNMAIKEASWKKVAHKIIVLVGDAAAQTDMDSYKNVDRLTIPGVVAMAQPTGDNTLWSQIQIHALRIVAAAAEQTKGHFDELVAGRQYPGIHGEYASSGDETKFIGELESALTELAGVTEQIATGRFGDLEQAADRAASGGKTRRLLGPVLPMLNATGNPEGNTPTFTEGYAVTLDPEGNRALEPHVLVSQGQLKLFSSALDFCITALEEAGDPGNRDVQRVVKSLQMIATSINMKEPVDPDMPLSKLLLLILGFPVRNPIFDLTPVKLAAMTTRDYEGWVQQVRASESISRSHLENGSIWFELGDQPGGASQNKHAFIKVADLP